MKGLLRKPDLLAAIVFGLLIVGLSVFSIAPIFKASAENISGDIATTTTSAMASATLTTQLSQAPAVLGSVVVSSSSPFTTYSQITVYDATSTMATATAKVLARFGTSNQQQGTYQFDAAAAYGLKLEVAPGYNGNATITWR